MNRIFFILLAILPFCIKGQNINDIYNISAVNYQGTAKSAAMGNAMGAVGEDISAISINPAGLGLYRKSSFAFTPSLLTTYTKSEYFGNIEHDNKTRLNINNIGYVNTNKSNNIKVNWAWAMNKTNNFNNRIFVNGFNPNNSLIDAYFAEIIANDIYNDIELEEYSPSYIYPIWATYLFDFNNDGSLTAYVPEGGIQQLKGVQSWGGTNEWTFASSININDKLFLGLSINLPNVNNSKITDYEEIFEDGGDIYSWWQQETLYTTGWGFNGKLGLIAYPARWLRIGAAFHSPTIYNLTDRWRTETMSWESTYIVPTSFFNYTLQTPWMLNGSAAFIFGNYGMFSVDYEYVDYKSIKLYAPNYDYGYYNDAIKETFRSSMNLRLGTEWRYHNMCFRGGYSFYGSPYGIHPTDGFYNKHNRNSISCGFGFTQHAFSFDFAYVYAFQNQEYNLYSQYSGYYDEIALNIVNERYNAHSLVFTIRVKML